MRRAGGQVSKAGEGMSELDNLQNRIASAMERIAYRVEKLNDRVGTAAPAAPGLAEALEEEKLANSQLQERLRVLNQNHFDELARLQSRLADAPDAEELARLRGELAAAPDAGEVAQLRAQLQAQSAAVSRLDTDLQRLRQANDKLRASNAALREANEAGVGEPHLINSAMLAELEGLRAAHAADAAEAAAVLAQLEPLLAHAGAGEDHGEDA